MKTMLAENIRRLRRERSLTQEQLAEMLGVTAGAVYKWEAKLSVPDLDLIVEMADFFDTSVDVLLGYEMKDNRLDASVKRLQDYRRRKDRAGLAEAEKALKKYPHSFEICNESAYLYSCFGIETGDSELLRRALALHEQSLLLLPQNTDPEISEQTLCGKMAMTHMGLGETDKAVELWKAHNAGGLYNHRIGETLAISERTDEAVPFLAGAMSRIVNDLIITIIGYVNVYGTRQDHPSLQAIVRLGLGFCSGLREGNKPNYLDKVSCALLPALAWSQLRSGNESEARESLRKARDLAAFFDKAPSYDEKDIRFIEREDSSSAYDDIGATAMDAVNKSIYGTDDEALAALWREVSEQEEHHG